MAQVNESDTHNRVLKQPILVNHVMSREWKSKIFEDFLGYFRNYSPSDITHVQSIEPIDDADIYHYHRPNAEAALRQRSIATVHHDLEDSEPWLAFSGFDGRYREAQKVVCLSTQQQNFLRERGILNTCIIPHGYNPDVFQNIERSKHRRTVLGLASKRYGRRVKGEALLLELARRLPPEDFEFLLIGAGRTLDAIRLNEFGFEVKVYEHLPYRQFRDFYASIDALLVLSWHEGGPACIPEAIATGTPIFSTEVGMAADYVSPGMNGELLSRVPDEDAKIMIKFASDNEYRNNIISGALNAMHKACTWSDVVDRYSEIYRELSHK